MDVPRRATRSGGAPPGHAAAPGSPTCSRRRRRADVAPGLGRWTPNGSTSSPRPASSAGEYPPLSDIAPAAFYEECEIYEQFGVRPAASKPLNRVALPPPMRGRTSRGSGITPAGSANRRTCTHRTPSAGRRSSSRSDRSARSGVESLYYGLVTSGEEIVDLYLFTWHKHRGRGVAAARRTPGAKPCSTPSGRKGSARSASSWAFAAAAEAALGVEPPPQAHAHPRRSRWNWNGCTTTRPRSRRCASRPAWSVGQAAAEIALERLLRVNAATFGHRYLFGVVGIGGARRAPDSGGAARRPARGLRRAPPRRRRAAVDELLPRPARGHRHHHQRAGPPPRPGRPGRPGRRRAGRHPGRPAGRALRRVPARNRVRRGAGTRWPGSGSCSTRRPTRSG